MPADYRDFIVNYNGGIPNEKSFERNGHNYAITRFLCMLKNVQESPNACKQSLGSLLAGIKVSNTFSEFIQMLV